MSCGDFAAAVFNKNGTRPISVSLNFTAWGWGRGEEVIGQDLWAEEYNPELIEDSIPLEVPPNDTLVWRFTRLVDRRTGVAQGR
jgi:hypothetical protein